MTARAAPPVPRRRGGLALPLALATVVALTVVVGVWLDRRGVALGTPLPPFLGPWHPEATPWAVLGALVVFATAAASPSLVPAPIGPVAFALASLALALVTRVTLATSRIGPEGLWHVFGDSFEAKNEYLPALPALSYGARWFLDHFAELVPSLPVHVAGHPPGLMLALHGLGITTPQGMAALTIGVGALSAPLTYVLARALLDEPLARTATLLYVLAPSALLYGATSADALFATVGLAAAVPLVAARPFARPIGALLLAGAALFGYALLAIGAWATFVVALREGLRRAAALAAMCALGLVAFYAALWALTGFDLLGALASTDQVYGYSVARIRPYAYWVFGSPAAYLLALGVPTAWYAARALAARQSLALALAAVILIAAVAGFTKAETERIWLFLVPLACLAAAPALPARSLGPVLLLLAVQCVAAELLFGTVW